MEWGGPFFVLTIIAISTIGWVMNNWIRAKHGYAPTDDWGTADGSGRLDDNRKVALLTSENEKLTGQVGRLEERVRVLERIATDRGTELSHAIERLRDERAAH